MSVEYPDPVPQKEESLFEAPPMAEQERMVEAILFASAEPVTVAELQGRMPHGCEATEALVYLRKRYAGRGVQVVKVGAAWAIRTAGDLSFLMQKETVESRKLSRAAIETLAIIAYHQPVTRAEIEEIRGVSVSRGTVDQLLEMDWIRFGRRRMTPGRPVTFVMTQTFLDHFGLETSKDLPGLKDLRAAGLLESRVDAGVYRAKFVATVFAARQVVNHGHVRVNGKKVNIASYRVSEGDVIEVRDRSKQMAVLLEATQLAERDVPDYIDADHSKMTAIFVRTPGLGDVPYPVKMEPNLVVEFYAKN